MPATIWALIILLLYSIHADDIPEIGSWDMLSSDKLAHVFMFTLLVHLMQVGLYKQTYRLSWKQNALKISVSFGLIYGSILELIQGTVFASRTTELADLLANSIGVGLGVILFRVVYGRLSF